MTPGPPAVDLVVQELEDVAVVVVGAGQAGLATAHHLHRRGLGDGTVVLDANPGPGGAWQHRWPSLTLGAAHGVHDLPGLPLGTPDPTVPASEVVADYYRRYEETFDLRVRRPVRVRAVTSPDGPDGPLLVETNEGTWRTAALVNATGTWDRPYWPHYPGRERFAGRQLHTHDFRRAQDLAGLDVVVVGGGASAVQHLLELADAGARTTWVTRRPPRFVDRAFDADWGRDVERRVRERVEAGLPPLSVVTVTGLPATERYRQGVEAGVLVAREMFTDITETGVRFADGTEQPADVILWATGFRPVLEHLAPLRLREPGGGVRLDGTTVVRDSRVQLAGYGPGASTLGATRTGRSAALAVARRLGRAAA